MVTIDNDLKSKLGKMTDNDGKIIITDDMPEDLQAAIKYLNKNNISIFSGADPEAYVDDFEPDPFAPDFVDGADDTMLDSSSDSDDDDEEIEDDDTSVDDLENMF